MLMQSGRLSCNYTRQCIVPFEEKKCGKLAKKNAKMLMQSGRLPCRKGQLVPDLIYWDILGSSHFQFDISNIDICYKYIYIKKTNFIGTKSLDILGSSHFQFGEIHLQQTILFHVFQSEQIRFGFLQVQKLVPDQTN